MQLHDFNTSVSQHISHEPVAMLVVDMATNTILEANKAASLLYFNEKNNVTLIHQDSSAFLPPRLHADFFHQELLEPYVFTYCCADGTTKEIEATPFRIGPREAFLCVWALRDITQELYSKKISARQEDLLQNIPSVAVQGYGMDGTVRYWNKASEAFYGYKKEEALGKNLLDLIIPEYMKAEVREAIATMAATGKSIASSELALRHKNGTTVEVYSSHALVKVAGCEPEFFCIDVDVGERNRAHLKEQLAASVFTYANEGILITDGAGVIVEANDAFVAISGYAREEIIGKKPCFFASTKQTKDFYSAMWEALKSEGRWCAEVWNKKKDGSLYPRLLTVSTIKDTQGVIRHCVAMYADITHIKAHEEVLEKAAYYDFLTGVPNRACFMERLEEAVSQAKARHALLALAYIDLDGFKTINDKYGHGVGDEILVSRY